MFELECKRHADSECKESEPLRIFGARIHDLHVHIDACNSDECFIASQGA